MIFQLIEPLFDNEDIYVPPITLLKATQNYISKIIIIPLILFEIKKAKVFQQRKETKPN